MWRLTSPPDDDGAGGAEGAVGLQTGSILDREGAAGLRCDGRRGCG